MKKTLFLFTAILLATISMNGQDLLLTWEGDTLGSTYTVWGEPDSSEIVFRAVVHNISGQWMKVKVRRNQVEMYEGTSSYFCWGDCFTDDVEESPESILIVSGGSSTDTAFSGHFLPETGIGSSLVEYTFFNAENEDQQLTVLVKYWASPEGVADDLMKNGSISDLYPNPARGNVTIDYDLPPEIESAGIRIFNQFGSLVKEAEMNRAAQQQTVDVSGLNPGIYFYSIVINNQLYQTKKLIIQN